MFNEQENIEAQYRPNCYKEKGEEEGLVEKASSCDADLTGSSRARSLVGEFPHWADMARLLDVLIPGQVSSATAEVNPKGIAG